MWVFAAMPDPFVEVDCALVFEPSGDVPVTLWQEDDFFYAEMVFVASCDGGSKVAAVV